MFILPLPTRWRLVTRLSPDEADPSLASALFTNASLPFLLPRVPPSVRVRAAVLAASASTPCQLVHNREEADALGGLPPSRGPAPQEHLC